MFSAQLTQSLKASAQDCSALSQFLYFLMYKLLRLPRWPSLYITSLIGTPTTITTPLKTGNAMDYSSTL